MIDKDKDIHWQAFQNQQIKATKRNNKPAYKTFKDFYDYEKQVEAVLYPKTDDEPKYSAKVVDILTREYTL